MERSNKNSTKYKKTPPTKASSPSKSVGESEVLSFTKLIKVLPTNKYIEPKFLSSKDCFIYNESTFLGQGSFSQVYKATHKELKDVYALKVIKKSLIENDMTVLQQINKEIEILYKIEHPHIIKLYSHFEDEDSIYLVLPYFEHGNLFEIIYKQRKMISFKQNLIILFQLIKALNYLHSQGIIYRDIKPENILFDKNYNLILSDFSLADYVKDNEYLSLYCGSKFYLAPEIFLGKNYNKEIDLWSYGILCCELFNRRIPFEYKTYLEGIKKGKVLLSLDKDFPPLVKNFVRKILKINPKERLSSSAIMNHSIFKVIKDEGSSEKNFKIEFNMFKPIKKNSFVKKVIKDDSCVIKSLDEIYKMENTKLKEEVRKLKVELIEQKRKYTIDDDVYRNLRVEGIETYQCQPMKRMSRGKVEIPTSVKEEDDSNESDTKKEKSNKEKEKLEYEIIKFDIYLAPKVKRIKTGSINIFNSHCKSNLTQHCFDKKLIVEIKENGFMIENTYNNKNNNNIINQPVNTTSVDNINVNVNLSQPNISNANLNLDIQQFFSNLNNFKADLLKQLTVIDESYKSLNTLFTNLPKTLKKNLLQQSNQLRTDILILKNQINDEIKNTIEKTTDICSQKTQTIQNDKLKFIQNEMNKLLALQNKQKDQQDKQSKINKLESEVEYLSEKLELVGMEKECSLVEKEKLKNDIERLKKENRENLDKVNSEIRKLKNEILEHKFTIQNLKEEEQELSNKIAEYEDELEKNRAFSLPYFF